VLRKTVRPLGAIAPWLAAAEDALFAYERIGTEAALLRLTPGEEDADFVDAPVLGDDIGVLATNVAIHEVRHVLHDPPRLCETCRLDGVATVELSAYLAEVADGPTPYTTVCLGCDILELTRGQHARAPPALRSDPPRRLRCGATS
jgi:hypothetical protein